MTARSSQRLEIFERIEDVPPTWDEIVGGDRCLGLLRPFLRVVERHSASERKPRYLLYTSSHGSAIAVGEILDHSSAQNPVAGVLLGRLERIFPLGIRPILPMLALRSRVSSDGPLRVSNDSPDPRKVLDGMLQELGEHADRSDLSLVVDAVPSEDHWLTDALSASGYLATLGRPYAELRLGQRSWEDFLAFGRQRNRRAAATIRNEERRALRAGIVFPEWDPNEFEESSLHRLLDAHARRLTGRSLPYEAGFVRALLRAMGRQCQVHLAVHERRVLGVTVMASQGGRGYALFPGLVEREQRRGFLYFNLCLYQPVRRAIESGLSSVAFGNAAYQAKIRRGCRITMTEMLVRPRSAFARTTLKGPFALHRRILERKYGWLRDATPFSFPER